MTWQPIATAPKDGTLVDLWAPESGRHADAFWSTERGAWMAQGYDYNGDWGVLPEPPIAWQPLPKPPDPNELYKNACMPD